jgi:hypothetical protein
MSNITKLDDSNGVALQPAEITIDMKPHQLTILKAAINLETTDIEIAGNGNRKHIMKTKFGVLCDNVGAGKSLQMLAIIANSKSCKREIEYHYSLRDLVSINTVLDEEQETDNLDINVLVVPHTIIKQWSKYIEDYTTLSYIQISGKKHLDDFIKNVTDNGESALNDKDIILVSSTKYRDFVDYWVWTSCLANCTIARIIFDEADVIKISRIKNIKTAFTWYITSSYKALQHPNGIRKYSNAQGTQHSTHYNLQEGFIHNVWISGITNSGLIKETFKSLSVSLYKDIIYPVIFLKNKTSYIKNSFNLTNPILNRIICKNTLILNVLNQIVNPTIMNMINAGNIQGAMENMNCYKVEDNNLIQTVTNELNIELENKKIEHTMKSQMIYSSEIAKKHSLEKIEKDIRDIENKIKILVDRINEHNVCSICFDDIDNKTILKCCHSAYCFQCISTWLSSRKKCPHCRSDINSNSILLVCDKVEETKNTKEDKLDTKLNKLKQIILERRKIMKDKFKFLVFTEFENLFDELKPFLVSNDFKFALTRGSGSSVNKQIQKFKTYPESGEERNDCLLLNSQFCGNGLNLENATDVFIYHSMSKEMTNQVIGRAQRPGRTSQLNVWSLCYENENV